MSDLKITTMSDTHSHHQAFHLSGGDFLLHAGDQTGSGRIEKAIEFLDWLQGQDYSHIVVTPGNHDWCYQKDPERMRRECADRGIHLLMDEGIILEGIKFWGSPVQPWFHDWAFNKFRGRDIKKHWDMIPSDTEVLITHGPPHGILDLVPRNERVGCEELMLRINELPALKLHVFGHIHEGRGYLEQDGRLFVNASSLDGHYQIETRKQIEIIRDSSGNYKVV